MHSPFPDAPAPIRTMTHITLIGPGGGVKGFPAKKLKGLTTAAHRPGVQPGFQGAHRVLNGYSLVQMDIQSSRTCPCVSGAGQLGEQDSVCRM